MMVLALWCFLALQGNGELIICIGFVCFFAMNVIHE